MIEAITGKPYSGKATATKVKNEEGAGLLEKLLGGAGTARTLMSVLRWFASPAGLWLLGAAGVGALLLLIREGLYKLAENTPNMKALSPNEAQALLQNGSQRDIDAAGGREALEDIVKNGKKKAEDILAMPETTEEEKAAKKKALLAAGGEDKVKAIAADTQEYTVPTRNAEAEMPPTAPPKADFVAGKPGTGGKNLAPSARADVWDKKYGPYYNEDGTKKTATPVPAEQPAATPTPAAGTSTETAPAASPGGAGGASAAPAPTTTPPAGGGASSASPMAPPATGSALPAASNEHAALSIPQSSPDASSVVNNAQMASTTGDVPQKAPLPAVRNVDSSFRDMIIRSTRVV